MVLLKVKGTDNETDVSTKDLRWSQFPALVAKLAASAHSVHTAWNEDDEEASGTLLAYVMVALLSLFFTSAFLCRVRRAQSYHTSEVYTWLRAT